MGSNNSIIEIRNLPGHSPPLQQYFLLASTPSKGFSLWRHRFTNESIIQYQFPFSSSEVLHFHMKQYLWRYNHPLLVSTLFFDQKGHDHKYSIYYERVLTNLSRIKDLCIEDSFQFYYTAIKGFELLSLQYGCFQVEQEMFHITKNKKVKVWCDENISRLFPAVTGKFNESTMIRQILQIIDKNIDWSRSGFHVGKYLMSQKVSTFQQARVKFLQFCINFNIKLGGKLKCVDTIEQGGVSDIVDIYVERQRNKDKVIDKGKDKDKSRKGFETVKSKSEKNTQTMQSTLNLIQKYEDKKLNLQPLPVRRKSHQFRQNNLAHSSYQIVRINNSVFIKSSRSVQKEKKTLPMSLVTDQSNSAHNRTRFVEPTNKKLSQSKIAYISDQNIITKYTENTEKSEQNQKKFFNVFQTINQEQFRQQRPQLKSMKKTQNPECTEKKKKQKTKNYTPQIDSDIWDDMINLRKKEKIT